MSNLALRVCRFTAGCLCVAAAIPSVLAGQLESPRRGIDHNTRLTLNRARATGKTEAVVLFVTDMGKTDQVVNAATALGARVQARFDDVGYFRVVAPVRIVERLGKLAHVVDMRVDVGGVAYNIDADPHPGRPLPQNPVSTTAPRPRPSKSAALPLLDGDTLRVDGPYTHARDLRAATFLAEHPTYDGRGVTIGMLEGVGEFAHPALSRARNLQGDSIAKIAGVISAESFTPPRTGWSTVLTVDTVSPRLVRAEATVDAAGDSATFWFDGQRYLAPAPGHYRAGRYTSGSARVLVLWDPARRVAWIDSDRNRDFRGETPLADINTKFSIAMVKQDSTERRPRRSQSVAIVFDSATGDVHAFDGNGGHATMVASVATGHNFMGGPTNGVAPGARILYIHSRAGIWGSVEGYVRAARDPRVDLMTTSMLGRTYPIAGESILPLVLNRLVAVYKKPFIAAAGNAGPYGDVISEPAATPSVIAAGAYISRDMYAAQFGWKVPNADYLVHYSSRGPSGLGMLKPDVLAPNSGIAADILSPAAPAGAGTPTYRLPPAYQIAGGTSAAAPTTAGSVALLISAAKQAGIPYDAPRILWALRMSARQLANYQIYEQGHGLIDIPKAWDYLNRAASKDFVIPSFEVRAPTRIKTDRYHRTPGVGFGIYEREGWTAGMSEARTVTITRTSGPSTAESYALRWLNNDGTFSTASSVTLPLNRAVAISVAIKPATAGMHSAALEIVDNKSGLPLHRIGAAVVAAQRLTADNSYTFRASGGSPWPRPASYFVDVPEGTESLDIGLAVAAGKLGVTVKMPEAPGAETIGAPVARNDISPSPSIVAGDSGTVLVPHPQAGVWEIVIAPPAWNRNADDTTDAPAFHVDSRFALTVRAAAAGVQAQRAPDGASSFALTMRNRFAPLVSGAVRGTLATRRVRTGTAEADAAGPMFDIDVDSGATMLRLDLQPSDANATLDLYLYHCATGPCRVWEIAMTSASAKSITVRQPEPGLWRVIVDPTRLPSGRAGFTLTEVIANPRFGAVDIQDAAVPRAAGAAWTAGATARPNQQGRAEPLLAALFEVVDEGAERIERAFKERSWTRVPNRPIPLGLAVVPLVARAGGR